MGKIVSKTELCDIVGKTPVSIDRWREQGMPEEEKGRKGAPNKYDTEKVIQWLLDRQNEKLDYTKEKARLTKLQADRQQIELDIMRSELLKADEVKHEWSNTFNQIKSKLLTIPTRAATLLQGVDSQIETKTVIEKLLREALEKIAASE